MVVMRTKQPRRLVAISIESFPRATREQLKQANLERLSRLIRLYRDHFDELNEEGHQLFRRAIFTCYCDCIDAKCKTEAIEILRKAGFATSLKSKRTETKTEKKVPSGTDY